MVEKYLKIDDFCEFIILTQDSILADQMSNVQSVEDQRLVFSRYIIEFLLQI